MPKTVVVIGEFTHEAEKRVAVVEACQAALENVPRPTGGTDIQSCKLIALEFEFGGIVGSTKTRATLEVRNGPLKKGSRAK